MLKELCCILVFFLTTVAAKECNVTSTELNDLRIETHAFDPIIAVIQDEDIEQELKSFAEHIFNNSSSKIKALYKKQLYQHIDFRYKRFAIGRVFNAVAPGFRKAAPVAGRAIVAGGKAVGRTISKVSNSNYFKASEITGTLLGGYFQQEVEINSLEYEIKIIKNNLTLAGNAAKRNDEEIRQLAKSSLKSKIKTHIEQVAAKYERDARDGVMNLQKSDDANVKTSVFCFGYSIKIVKCPIPDAIPDALSFQKTTSFSPPKMRYPIQRNSIFKVLTRGLIAATTTTIPQTSTTVVAAADKRINNEIAEIKDLHRTSIPQTEEATKTTTQSKLSVTFWCIAICAIGIVIGASMMAF